LRPVGNECIRRIGTIRIRPFQVLARCKPEMAHRDPTAWLGM
jgi:hypothetical protein